MVKKYISEDYEFFEVLNAFPVLSATLEKLDIKQEWIKEGKTVSEVLQEHGFSHDEVGILVRRINNSIETFLNSSQKVYSKPQVSAHL